MDFNQEQSSKMQLLTINSTNLHRPKYKDIPILYIQNHKYHLMDLQAIKININNMPFNIRNMKNTVNQWSDQKLNLKEILLIKMFLRISKLCLKILQVKGVHTKVVILLLLITWTVLPICIMMTKIKSWSDLNSIS